MNSQPSFNSIDTFNCDAFPADASGGPPPILPSETTPTSDQAAPYATGVQGEPRDGWSDHFARTLQTQHARVREFLQYQRDRWRQAAAHFTRQIESLQAEIQALEDANEVLRSEPSVLPEVDPNQSAEDSSCHDLAAAQEVRDLKARNADLQRQLLESNSPAAGRDSVAPMASGSGNWEAQKRRFLESLASDDQHDAESTERRLKIEEIVARTDKIIAEKNHEIEELRYLLDNQSNSVGSLAIGAAALEQVFDQDALILEERQRLQQLQDECRAKLREAEIEIAMERARLARRDAEVEEKMRNNDLRSSAAGGEAEALAPTGRPIRGRWRTQLGLAADEPPESDRRRGKQ